MKKLKGRWRCWPPLLVFTVIFAVPTGFSATPRRPPPPCDMVGRAVGNLISAVKADQIVKFSHALSAQDVKQAVLVKVLIQYGEMDKSKSGTDRQERIEVAIEYLILLTDCG